MPPFHSKSPDKQNYKYVLFFKLWEVTYAHLSFPCMCLSLRNKLFFIFSMLDYDTENLNSEEIYSSLRGVTEAIEKFSFRSQEDLNEPIKRDGKKECDIVSIPRLKENSVSVK